MDGRAPLAVWAGYAEWRKREIPGEIARYLWAFRYVKTVQRNGVKHDGAWYFPTSAENIAHVGEKVEIRAPLDRRGVVHVFSLPERRFLFDAYLTEYTGDVDADMGKVGKMRKGKKEVLEEYRKRKAEFDKGDYRTGAEIYAAEKPPETPALKVVGGEPESPKAAKPRKSGLIPLFIK
jgi:hypothetical protein